jgi:uncharacterized membrane protein/mono/diheme cytochrome c family protein
MTPTLLLADSQMGLPVVWETFVGRLHPMLVHFPIALLLLALLLECWGVRKRGPTPSAAALPCLVFGAMGAFAAGLTGWLLHEHDPPGRGVADLLEWHEWVGVAIALIAPVAAILAWSGRKGTRPRSVETARFMLCMLAVLIPINGHLGGKMVHGREYLTAPLWEALGWSPPSAPPLLAPKQEPEEVEELAEPGLGDLPVVETDEPLPLEPSAGAIDFARDVAPIFAARCLECHGAAKTKGDLRLDLPPDEGDDPHVIVPGDPDGSELIQLVSLAADDLDIMPAKGDPLSAEQIETLRRWIAEGAVWGEAAGG